MTLAGILVERDGARHATFVVLLGLRGAAGAGGGVGQQGGGRGAAHGRHDGHCCTHARHAGRRAVRTYTHYILNDAQHIVEPCQSV